MIFFTESYRNDAEENTFPLCEHGNQPVLEGFQTCIQT